MGSNASDALAKSSDHYIGLDYSDVDRLSAVAEELNIDFLVPGCNDLSYEVCARVAAQRGYPGFEAPEAVAQLHQKAQFRELCRAISVSVPQVFASADAASRCGGAVIVKPVDAYSGRGVTVIRRPNQENLAAAVDDAKAMSRSGEVIIEQFVDGQLYSYSAFLNGGKVAAGFSVQEFCSVNPFVVDTSYVLPDQELSRAVASDIETLAQSVGLQCGLLHVQYISDGLNYWLIEPARRCPGDLYSELITRSTGYPYAAAFIAPFIGEAPLEKTLSTVRPIIRRTVAAGQAGIFRSVSFGGSGPVDCFLLATVGEQLTPSPGGRVALAFFNCENEASKVETVTQLLDGALTKIEFMDTSVNNKNAL